MAAQSQDLGEIKKGRSAIKGQITTAVKRLQSIFAQKIGEDFNHEQISKSEVSQMEKRLNENFDIFQQLHQKCCEKRDIGEDDAKEEKLAEEDEVYVEQVTSKVYPVFDMFVKYNRSVADFEAEESKKKSDKKAKADTSQVIIDTIPEKEAKYQKALDTYQNTKENALQVIKCLENLEADEILENSTVQIQPAEAMKETISKDFQTLATNAADLRIAMEARGDDTNAIEKKLKFIHSDEHKKMGKINIDLQKIIEAKKIYTEKNKSIMPNPVLSSTFKEANTVASPLKLNKPDPLLSQAILGISQLSRGILRRLLFLIAQLQT